MSTTATYAMVPPPAGVGLCRRSRTRRRTACVDPSFGLGPLDTWRFRTCGTRPLVGSWPASVVVSLLLSLELIHRGAVDEDEVPACLGR